MLTSTPCAHGDILCKHFSFVPTSLQDVIVTSDIDRQLNSRGDPF